MTLTTTLSDPPVEPAVVFDRAWQATPNNVGRARRALLDELRALEVDQPVLDAVSASLTEAMTNAVYHAYVGRRIGRVRVLASALPDTVAVIVQDDGCGFDPAMAKPGAGLLLIAASASRVETTERPGGGTRTAMWFDRA